MNKRNLLIAIPALSGVVSYVSAQGRGELAREVRAGLTDAVAACTDKPNPHLPTLSIF